jgi:hypothetical protein
VISYVWCSSCHRYVGSTGPLSATTKISDPLSSDDHSVLDEDLAALLKYLDELWDKGTLPPKTLAAGDAGMALSPCENAGKNFVI